jgi:uncharacterized protein (DUF1778 family)
MSAIVDKERITARVSTAVAETLNEAAGLSGTTLSNFVVQAALKEAQRLIDRERTIFMSNKDTAMLLDLLDNPPAPNPALSRAFERFIKVKYGAEGSSTGKDT